MKNSRFILSILAGAALMAASPFPVLAAPGHDHGDSAPAASGNAPKRLPDGSVFLPKVSQRQLLVRTLVTEEKQLAKSVELTGRVIMDANAGGRVQPLQPGRIEPGSRGLPQLGQAVRKGEVLAVVRSSAGAIEQANQQAQVAELSSQLELARRRASRMQQLEGSVPQKEIEAAQADAASLQQRLAAVSRSVSATETLVAPISGVISAANVVAGQVVDAREILFEVIDPSRLMVEALVFDVALLDDIASASATAAANVSVPLQLAGAGRAQREGAIPLQFRTQGAKAVPLSVNQPVKVLVQTRQQVKGVSLPAAAVVKNPSNQDAVWVHTGAETFVSRTVRATPLDGATVAVVDGLKPGERVVVQGAALINQVR
ncbi:efflux RND transporter periplasmic adaptor subunit [Variovorax sp. VNK109]|uniref:efflux RND transporter periplasmic adaptor subunit n=1 Tax=Variovorax sp. VNK109 TaxID=3400919 RepID=UPI003BFC21B4